MSIMLPVPLGDLPAGLLASLIGELSSRLPQSEPTPHTGVSVPTAADRWEEERLIRIYQRVLASDDPTVWKHFASSSVGATYDLASLTIDLLVFHLAGRGISWYYRFRQGEQVLRIISNWGTPIGYPAPIWSDPTGNRIMNLD